MNNLVLVVLVVELLRTKLVPMIGWPRMFEDEDGGNNDGGVCDGHKWKVIIWRECFVPLD